MRSRCLTSKGFSLVELLIVTALVAIVSLVIFQFINSTTKGAQNAQSATVAQSLADEILRTVKVHFSRRYWVGPKPSPGAPPVVPLPTPTPTITFIPVLLSPLTSPLAFSLNLGGASSYQCPAPDLTWPSCQNLKIVETITHPGAAVSADTYREIKIETTCQTGTTAPKFPPGFTATQYQPDGGQCTTAPVITMTTTDLSTGVATSTRQFLGEKIFGSAICFRSCKIADDAGPAKPEVWEYRAEVAVIYQGSGAQWNVVRGNSTYSSGDVSDGVQVLSQ